MKLPPEVIDLLIAMFWILLQMLQKEDMQEITAVRWLSIHTHLVW